MIQKSVGLTTIYVTHDQEEAFGISDKIAVMNDGKTVQFGTPRDIYFRPETLFSARFTGNCNIIPSRTNQPPPSSSGPVHAG